MADILLATDLSPTGFGRFVVIKRALSKFSDNEEFKDMFKNEGKVACNLKHRNITPIYEFGIERNQFFLAMEYVSGRNLRELIKKLQVYKSSLSLSNAVYIVKEVASGLNYAHNAIDSNTGQPLNIIHRDISPQNIMLSFDGEIKLIDFGIAKIADTNLTKAGHLKGKFSYMSPEQAQGQALDERTDIFCLGIILWELLTGKRLFASKNELTSLKKVKNCDVPDAQKINPKIPTELNNIIKKSLSKNKNSRYKTAAQLEQNLNVFLNKNYPEYSHYDFISLMKTTYRKEIMEEREKLKTYSLEFKKYLNTLNLEDTFKSQINLNIPDLKTFVQTPKLKKTETKSLQKSKNDSLQGTNESLISDYTNYLTNQTEGKNTSLNINGQTIKENSSTLIQKNISDTETGQNISKTQRSNTIRQSYPLAQDGSLNINTQKPLSLQNPSKPDHITLNKTQPSKTTQSLRLLQSRSTLYSTDEILDDEAHSSEKNSKSKTRFFLFLVLLITGLGGFGYLLERTLNLSHKLLGNVVKDIDIQAPASPPSLINSATPQRQLSSQERAIPFRKIFINSKPSGAAIYVNNKFSSKYTPSLITLTGDKLSNITIKKQGYHSKQIAFNPEKQNLNSISLTLTKNKEDISSKPIRIIQ